MHFLNDTEAFRFEESLAGFDEALAELAIELAPFLPHDQPHVQNQEQRMIIQEQARFQNHNQEGLDNVPDKGCCYFISKCINSLFNRNPTGNIQISINDNDSIENNSLNLRNNFIA